MRILFSLLFSLLVISYSSAEQELPNQISFSLSYIKGDIESGELNNLSKMKFQSMPGSESFGVNNGTYWLKLELDLEKEYTTENFFIYIPSHSIGRVELFEERNGKIVSIDINGRGLNSSTQTSFAYFPSFKLNKGNLVPTYYIKAFFPKEANFPLRISSEETFLRDVTNNSTLAGIYYGMAFIVFILNLFYFFKFNHKLYLFYAIFLLTLVTNVAMYDASFRMVSEFLADNVLFEMALHLAELLALMYFSIHFLNLRNTRPLLVKWIYVFPVIGTLFFILSLVTDNFLFKAIGDVVGISTFLPLWLIGLFMINKNQYARFYVLGYLLLMPVGAYYMIGYALGYWPVNGEHLIVKISSGFDMIVFTYAISYRMKILDSEKFQIQDFLENQVKLNTSESDYYHKLLYENNFTNEPLTLREMEIVKALNSGFSNAEISESCYISLSTVKTHCNKIYRKFDVKNRVELKVKIPF